MKVKTVRFEREKILKFSLLHEKLGFVRGLSPHS